MTQSSTASSKNSSSIYTWRAPRAFLMPMILVRSLTDTNMILAMPKPPTRMEKRPMKRPARLTKMKREEILSVIMLIWLMAKLSS